VISSGRPRVGPSALKWQGARWFGVLFATALLLTTLLGGQQYFYCRVMGRVMPRTCACATAHVDPSEGSVDVVHNDCWELRSVARLLSLGAPNGIDVHPASIAAIVPPIFSAPVSSAPCAFTVRHPIRAGPYSPTSARSKLMVYLT
jgi:hypothetical protein